MIDLWRTNFTWRKLRPYRVFDTFTRNWDLNGIFTVMRFWHLNELLRPFFSIWDPFNSTFETYWLFETLFSIWHRHPFHSTFETLLVMWYPFQHLTPFWLNSVKFNGHATIQIASCLSDSTVQHFSLWNSPCGNNISFSRPISYSQITWSYTRTIQILSIHRPSRHGRSKRFQVI